MSASSTTYEVPLQGAQTLCNGLWKIEMLGPLCARRGDQTVNKFRTQKTGVLLAYLAHSENRAARREELVDLLWPDDELESGRNRLRIALTALRGNLEGDLLPSGSVLIADRNHVQLNPDAYTTDIAEFEANLKEVNRAESDSERISALMRAAELYRDDLLPGYEEEWIIGERQRLIDNHLAALRKLFTLLAKAQNFDAALDYARQALKADQYREETHRAVMQLYMVIGRPGAAVRQYRELERLFREELQTAPSPAAQELFAQASAKAGGSGAGAERSTAVVNSAFPFPAQPRTSAPPLSRLESLPNALTRFFGREDCLAALLDMMDSPDNRLITLTGLGGSGKTRLSIALGERVYDEFGGAVWFVPLAQLNDPRQIVDAILRAMNVPRVGTAPPLDRLVSALSNRQTLLILDNFEHLLDGDWGTGRSAAADGKWEDGAAVVKTLLERVPTLTCLVTSRQRLNLAGEQEYAVFPLATPQTPGTPERLMEFASVQLFVDRAQAVRPGFQLSPANAASIAALCHHLEGVPLAIELAAAYAQMLTPPQILARLSPRFSLLVNRNRDAAPRHASLRAALDWSYHLLAPEVRRVFASLSVFRGGWTLEAAEAICDEPMALEYLMQLRERSLVTADEASDEMRYSLLETLREYAEEQLAPEDRAEAIDRFAAYFMQQAEEAEGKLSGPEAPWWLDRLAQDHDNLRAALDRCLSASADAGQSPSLAETGLRMAAALWRFWYIRGFHEEGYEWLTKALRLCKDTPAALRAKAARGAGNIAYNQGAHAEARALFQQHLALAQELGDQAGVAAAYGSLGNVANAQGDSALASVLMKKSLALFRELNDKRGLSLTLGNLANVASDLGDYPMARGLHEESLMLFRAADDKQNIALALNNLTHAVLKIGDYAYARVLLEESLFLGRCLESKRSLAHSLTGCITLASLQNSPQQAAMLMGAVEALRESIQAPLAAKAAPEYERERERIRGALGEEDYAMAWSQGRAMPLDQVIECALERTGASLRG